MAKWTKFPHAEKAYEYTPATLKKHWARLHTGDCEPFPKSDAIVQAWIAFHAGNFEQAAELGLAQGMAGYNVANKATNIYANYVEKSDKKKLDFYQEVAARCEEQQAKDKKDPNGFYLYSYAMGRYSQGISITKALAQGLGGKVKDALQTTLKLQPKHADAHIGLGAFHAEIIDKVGAMLGGVSYGAKKDEGLRLFKAAIAMMPHSAVAKIEYANGLVMLEGKKGMKQAEELYAEAAECVAMDAMERLDVEAAKEELE
jgi:hypothetical protein